MIKLDIKDKKMLSRLDTDCRMPISKLSKEIGLSRDAVLYRMKKLEREGLITGHHAIVDFSRLGYKMYRYMIKLYAIQKQEYEALLKVLNDSKEVFWIGETDGFIDLTIGIWTKSSEELNNFCNLVSGKFRKFIKKEFINEVVSYSYLHRKYFEKRTFSEWKIASNEKEKFDDIDLKIILILSTNARTPLIEISEKVNLDSSSLIYRIKQLEKKKIILGYKAEINLEKIERELYSVKCYLSNSTKKGELILYLHSQNAVTNFTEAIGGWDLEFDMEISSNEEYHRIVRDLKEKFDSVLEIEFYRVIRTLKTAKILN